jgi:hypothetical protein
MINTIEQFGRNAGRIWEVLNSNGPLTESQLLDFSSLRPYEFYIATGWLAREDKIFKDQDLFKLGNTNLTSEIGANAGKIWNLLISKDEIDIPSISALTELNYEQTFSALGWLARENKIQISLSQHD